MNFLVVLEFRLLDIDRILDKTNIPHSFLMLKENIPVCVRQNIQSIPFLFLKVTSIC